VNAMKSLQPISKDTSKQRGYRFWIGCFILLLGLPLLYYGYCWGWWGRQSLLLQYLFQCNCPPASEETRYPEAVDVVVPACRYSGSILSPSGRLLYVTEHNSKFSSTYLLDLQSNEKIPFTIGEGSNYFLTDDLLFLSLEYGHEGYKGGDYILVRTTGKQYPIQYFTSLRKDALYANGDLNLEVLAMELQDAENVYLLDNKIIVALISDFQASPESNFYIDRTTLPGHDPNRAEQFLQQNHIDFRAVPGGFQEEAVSPDGRFIARADGIYLAGSGEKVVEAYPEKGLLRSYYGKYFSVPRGWTSDSSGVIYSKFMDSCLLELPSYEGGTCSISVPQPLIKLRMPEEYLSPTKTP